MMIIVMGIGLKQGNRNYQVEPSNIIKRVELGFKPGLLDSLGRPNYFDDEHNFYKGRRLLL